MTYLIFFIITFLISLGLTSIAVKLSWRFKILDYPKDKFWFRRIHAKATPLLGGLAIMAAFIIVVCALLLGNKLTGENLLLKHVLAVLIGGAIIIIGGILDDKYQLKWWQTIIAPILAIITVIVGGLGIDYLSNPLGGGLINLAEYKIEILWFNGLPYYFTILADIFTLIWLMLIMYATKLLDGMDGLVGGIGLIGSLIIFFLSLTENFNQPDIAFLAIVAAGAIAGFLVMNWHPAKIFLGEGGSLLIGFLLGSLSIIAGSKVATTALILGLPVLDIFWSIIRRIAYGQNPFKTSDKKHLFHRFLAAGFSQRQTVLVFYFITIVFGAAGIFLQTREKINLLGLLLILMILIIISLSMVGKIKKKA